MSNAKATFSCKQCNHCCQRDGIVFLTMDDLHRLEDHFSKLGEDFKKKYCENWKRHIVLKSHPEGGCIFSRTADQRCPIYELRPEQCATYPYWPSAKTDRNWFKSQAKECPGIQV